MILWLDPVARIGDEAMAVDEALLTLSDEIILRIYRWKEPTITYGYFDHESEARRLFPDSELKFTRRWTGGGIVDHRNDFPFTLVLPHRFEQSAWGSQKLYEWIHGELARVLSDGNISVEMLPSDLPDGGRACFASPVRSDLVGHSGAKLAGGGQRRTRFGVVHQGSIQACKPHLGWEKEYARALAGNDGFTILTDAEPINGMNSLVEKLLKEKYSTQKWKQGARR